MAEASRARGLLVHRLAKRALVGEAGEVVGDRLLGDQLVQGDVLDRGRGLAEQVEEDLALGPVNGRPSRATVIAPTGASSRPILPSELASAKAPPRSTSTGPPSAQRPLLGRQRRLADRLAGAAGLGLWPRRGR